MFSPVQIKHECMGVEDVHSGGRSNTGNNPKYPIFVNHDAEYRYPQLSEFWDHTQLSNEMRTKNEINDQQGVSHTENSGSLAYVKDYLQNGVLFQVNQHPEDTGQSQVNQQCHQDMTQKCNQSQLSQNMQQSKLVNQTLTTAQTTASIKHNRPGRPPKGSSESNMGKKLKCQCEICFKEFGHKSNLFIHMRTHNGERPYKCNQCEKCFTHSGNLAIHMRTHSGERPYGCQICGKMFSHSGNLSTHLRTHSGVKPYKCSICAKEFRHSGNLSIHERIHSGIKPFQCKVCGKDFYHSGNLTTHMKKHSVNINANVNQCENNETQMVCATDHNGTASLNPLNNLALPPVSDVKLLPNSNNIVPIKNESNDESITNTMGILSQTAS